MRFGTKGKGNIYQDEQNVHDEDIKQSVLDSVGKLFEWEKQAGRLWPSDKEDDQFSSFRDFADSAIRDMCSRYKIKVPTEAEVVIERLCIDTTSYNTEVNENIHSFNIAEVFEAVVNYISKVKDKTTKKEMANIFIVEMKAMAEWCASGYVSRLLNVLQGFDDRFTIVISFKKQLFSVISYYLQKNMERASEEAMLGSCEEKYRPAYATFIADTINQVISKIIETYGKEDVLTNIVSVLEEFAGFKGWELSDEKVIWNQKILASSEGSEEEDKK